MVSRKVLVLLILTVFVSGCAAGRAFRKGRDAARAGDWDAAVRYHTEALQEDPDNAEYKIELERATQNAARPPSSAPGTSSRRIARLRADRLPQGHRARSANRPAGRAAELERIIRDRIEKWRQRAEIEKLRQQARTQGVSVLNPADRTPLKFSFNNSSLRDILNFIGTQSGINIQFDQAFTDKPYSVTLDGIALEEALQQILSVNGYFYKVINQSTIVIAPDTLAGHQKYDELVMQVFYLSHADTQEVSQALNSLMRIQTQVAPAIYPNKTSNTIAIRATAPIVAVAEKLIRALDKPRAEVIIEVQIRGQSRTSEAVPASTWSDYSMGLTFCRRLRRRTRRARFHPPRRRRST